MLKYGLSGLACVAATMCSAAAMAQVSQDIAPATQPAAGTPADTGEIVVTAQRRAQRLVDVPVSVTTVSADMISKAGVTGLLDLTKTAPGVVLDKNGAYLQPTIRGIGTNVTGPGADPNVAIYVDGIYQSSQTGNFFELANVQDVEILKGPQGTLFGRNATGGAILVKLLDPSFTTSGKFNISYGRFNEVATSGYFTAGLTDKLAFDVSAYYRHSDGWIHDLRTGDDQNRQHSLDIRSKLLFKPTDTLKFVLAAAHNDTSDPTGLAIIALGGNSAGRPLPDSGPIATERGTLSNDLAPKIKVHSNSVSLHGELDLGFATLASITSYRHEKSNIAADLDGSYAIVQEATYSQVFKDFTQEVNLTSAAGSRFSYVVGAFYFHEHSGNPYFDFNSRPFYHGYLTTDALSGYADGTYKIGKLSIIAGIRYSSEKKRLQYARGTAAAYTVDTNHTFGDFTPRGGLSFALSRNSNVYFTYSKGFKSGTYNLSSGSITPVNPEKVDAFEVGVKHQSRAFSFNASGFYYKYSNIQITAFDYTVGISRLINAAKAKIYGLDADATLRLTDRFTLRAAAGYTHGEFTSFPGAVTFVPIGGDNGNRTVIQDESGTPLLRAPKFTFSGTADYRLPLGDNAVELSATPYYSSKINYSFGGRIQQPHYFTLDANLAYIIRSNLRLSLYGRNLTNKAYATFRSASSTRDGITYAAPRAYGVSASYNF